LVERVYGDFAGLTPVTSLKKVFFEPLGLVSAGLAILKYDQAHKGLVCHQLGEGWGIRLLQQFCKPDSYRGLPGNLKYNLIPVVGQFQSFIANSKIPTS
jgi:hypothetical protein